MRLETAHPFFQEMSELICREDETMEDLQFAGLRVFQKKNGFRFGMDAVLLADFARINPHDYVGDFGTGTGILPLLLWGRKKGARFTAVEILPDMAEMAGRSMLLNGLSDHVQVICGDVAEASRWIAPHSLDAIVCNPPYGLPGRTLTNPQEQRRIARHQNLHTLDAFLKSAWEALRGKGIISLIYPAPQMLELMNALKKHGLEPKRFRLVYPYSSKPANLVLIEAMRDAKPTLHPMPPLILYEENGRLTNELKSIYHIEEQTAVQSL